MKLLHSFWWEDAASDREFGQQQLSFNMEIQLEILQFAYIYARSFASSRNGCVDNELLADLITSRILRIFSALGVAECCWL
jgi:hypothetical protein